MTLQEAKEFFEKVKGRKIRYYNDSTASFLPQFLNLSPDSQHVMSGECISELGIVSSVHNVLLMNGFNSDSNGNHWYFVDEPERVEIKADIEKNSIKKCTCSSSDLFNYGCKCGGK